MRLILTFILVINIFISYGQEFTYPVITKNGASVKDFIPGGWKIIDTAIGDLNKDKLNDVVIILQHTDSIQLIKSGEFADTVITQPRILVILFKDSADNRFHLIEQNNSFILNHDSTAMDDPYLDLKINNGFLQIDFQLFYNMGSWYTSNSSYKFRYRDGEFILIGADLFSIHRATLDYEEYSYNFLVKKRSLTKGNEKKGTKKTVWKVLDLPTLKTLRTFKEPYSWEAEPDVYL